MRGRHNGSAVARTGPGVVVTALRYPTRRVIATVSSFHWVLALDAGKKSDRRLTR